MPISRTKKAVGGTDYGSPFVGPMGPAIGIPVPIGALTNTMVDANGILKPGVPLTKVGAAIGVAPAFVYGCVAEAVKVAASNSGTDLTAAGTKEVAVIVSGTVNQDILEDILGRALTADELAGFDRAGCKLVLA